MPGGGGQPPGKVQLEVIGERIALPHGGRRQSDERADVVREAIGLGAVQVHRGLGVRPGAVEKRQQPVVEDVGEAGEGRVARLPQAIAGIFRQVQRQGSMRAEEAEEKDLHPRRNAVAAGNERTHRPRRESHRRLLAQADRVVLGPRTLTQSRLRRGGALQSPQRLEEVERVRGSLDLAQKRYKLCRRPIRIGHFIISPRSMVRTTVSVNELMET